LELLVGQAAPFNASPIDLAVLEGEDASLGHSQFNELLLLFGLDRVSYPFFCFLLGSDDQEVTDFESETELRARIDEFRKTAMLLYGNVKYGFKRLSMDVVELDNARASMQPVPLANFATRHPPVLPVARILPDDAYLTGYLIERELAQRLAKTPDDKEARALEERRLAVVEAAKTNHSAYLASDHLDVYVATSMRQRAEFRAVSTIASDIFAHPVLADMQLRYFDPTQAYCANRVDKGLAEALMLRRADCTIYLIQETDTLGKDSELASTLAQGKPVIAFIPAVTEALFEDHLKNVALSEPAMTEAELLLSQLQVFDPSAPWVEGCVRGWCENPQDAPIEALRERLCQSMRSQYDRRAKILRDDHPLGIQVNLATGVANGVLVVRTIDDCAELVRRILTSTLEFDIVEEDDYLAMSERVSGCIFRVVTKDPMLTNSFWNHYVD